MSDVLRIAAVQFKAVKGDLGASRHRLCALAERAARGSDLLVLPEMAATGYVFPDAAAVERVAEPAEGLTFEALRAVAKTAGCVVVAGFPENDQGTLYNSAWVIDARGELAFVYRKTLLYVEDEHWAAPGDSGYHTFDLMGQRVGVGICMDINDDRFIDWLVRTDCDVVAFPTNWVMSQDEPPIDTWTYWAWRLTGIRSALVAANTWGFDGGIEFSGRSAVLKERTIHAALPERGDGMLRASLSRIAPDGLQGR
ncbi:MAG: carbon-nitrogen hydrolase family protein [Myxococcota bacterium]